MWTFKDKKSNLTLFTTNPDEFRRDLEQLSRITREWENALLWGPQFKVELPYYLMRENSKTIYMATNAKTRQEVYQAIDSERDYQAKKWVTNNPAGEHFHSPEDWCVYIEDYISEAKHLLARDYTQNAYPAVSDIFRKVAAMLVCAMEQLGVENRVVTIEQTNNG